MSTVQGRSNAAGGITWRVRFRHGNRQRSLTFATEAQAKSWQVILNAHGPDKALELLNDDAPTSRRTVADQVRHHIDHLTGVEEGTRKKYRAIQRGHLAGTFEQVLLEHLTRDDVSRWVNQQTASPKSIRNWHGLLSAALESAVRDDLIAKNVAKGIKLPRRDGVKDDMVLLGPQEFDEIASHLRPEWRPLAYFLVGTGMRWGEASALKVGDVNLEEGTVRIVRAWKDTSGEGWRLGPPKTRKGRRTAKVTHEALYRVAPFVDMRPPGDWLFTSGRGGPVRGDWWNTDVWAKAVREWAGPSKPTVHDLRHTFASWAIQAGVPLTVLQRQLGHESIQTTSDTYGHLAPSDFDALGAAIDARVARGRAVEGAVTPAQINPPDQSETE